MIKLFDAQYIAAMRVAKCFPGIISDPDNFMCQLIYESYNIINTFGTYISIGNSEYIIYL